MSESFEAGLRELHARAADAHANGSGLPTPALVSRARRNRRIRTAAISAAATVAVVGVALAGSAMAGLGDPAPLQPAQPSITARPSGGTYTGPACGTAIDDVGVFDEPPLVVELTLDQDVLEPAEVLSGRVVLAVAGDLETTLEPDGMLEGLDYTAVQDGVVVGYGRGALTDGTWQTLSGRQGATALVTVPIQPCSAGAETLAGGEYQLFASLPVTAADGQGEVVSRTILGGPWPFTVQESGWSPIDIAAVPVSAPGVDERLLRAEAHADGRRWRVTVEFDECQDTYGRAREALIAAGFALVSEGSDAERPSWSLGVFRDDDYDVELETSNETGGGCFGDYRITAH